MAEGSPQECTKVSTPEPFVPPPIISQHVILIVGVAIVVQLTLVLSTMLFLLVAVFSLSMFVPYCFRTTDRAAERRRLYDEFIQRPDPLIQQIVTIPDYVKLEEKYWTNSRGMALCTSIMTPKDTEPKAVIFFCHGFADSASFMKRNVAFRLVKENIAVATIEYEGHGRSDGTHCLIPDFDRMVNDTMEYFQEVADQKQFVGKKFFLMGESMGGAISFLAYKKKPSLYSGVIFIAPMCKVSDALKPPQWLIDFLRVFVGPIGTNGYFGFLPITPIKQKMDNLTHRDPIMRNLSKSVPFQFGRNPRLTTARELLDVTAKITAQLNTFDAPFIVQHGREDKITDPLLSQAFYDESSSLDKTIKLYDEMRHALLADVPSGTDIVINDTIQWVLKRL